ncbi:hypothetical protein AWE61_19705 [Escherichia coli]|nr:hypothetical protein AWE61_19705 [Escherichia coli]
MNTNNIKKYAPQARNDFRDAVIQKLTTLGIAADKKGNLQIAEAETIGETGSDSNLLIVFYVQIMPDDLVMQLHRF